MSASQAVDYGLIDEVLHTDENGKQETPAEEEGGEEES
jgi:ATP-dependent protease ClpP protease subunit